MTTICPTKVQCECFDEPIENLSGEGPDNPSFLGIFRPPYTPRIGRTFENKGCVSWCFSAVSQAEADLCAEQQAIECQEENVFYSATKTCQVICPSGLGVSETVKAGTVISAISQADADTRAESLACKEANLTACSGVVLPVGNEAQGVSCIEGTDLIANVALPSNLSISGPTLTVAANSFSAQTQAQANALAAQYVSDFMNAGLASGDLECCDNIFHDLVWGAPVVTHNVPGDTTYAAVVNENTFDIEVTAGGAAFGDTTVECTGTVSYTGSAKNCNLHFIGTPDIQSSGYILVSSSVDGTLVEAGFNVSNIVGTYDLPFVVPASAGAIITVYAWVRASGNVADPGHLRVNGNVQSCLEEP